MTQPAAPSRPTPMKRNAAIVLFMLLALAVAFVGCDSEDADPIDEDVVGTWNATSARVIVSGVSVPVFEAGDEGTLAITFASEGTFTFVAEGPIAIEGFGLSQVVLAEDEGATIDGTYAFEAGDEAISFTPTDVDGQPIGETITAPVPVTFEDDDTVVLTVENTEEGREFLTFLLGGQVPQEVIDNIDGGEVTFTRGS